MTGHAVDAAQAAALGWPKLKYAFVERERRWLCDPPPEALVTRAEVITDLYVTGTSLRLREALPIGSGEPQRRLARKADVRADTRLITSIYLSAAEFALFAGFPGKRLQKTRYHLAAQGSVLISVDVFHGALAGLALAEAEFESDQAMQDFVAPDRFGPEVTFDSRYTGGALIEHGLP
jgi:CYTH domain-containing protein